MYALIDISNQMLAVIGSPSHIMGASMRPYLLLSHLHRRNRRILALNNES